MSATSVTSAPHPYAHLPNQRSPLAAARVAALVVVGALALLAPAPVAAHGPSPIVFDARDDFRVSPDEANPSPPWSYRQTGPGGSTPLLDEFWTDHAFVPGLETWHGQEISTSERDKLPFVGVNTSGVDQHVLGVDWPAGALLVHPGSPAAAVIRWRSPAEGLVRIRARIIDRDANCGEGVRWAIRLVGRGPLARGVIANGGSAVAIPRTYPALAGIDVDPGTRIELRVGPKDHNGCDSTQVAFRIVLRPGDF